MKILVLQLARLGDILMTWPALRALRRAHPDAEIHLLVRPRFEAATAGFDAVDRVRVLPTTELLEPLVRTEAAFDEAQARMETYLGNLRGESYDRIVNLSFSPLSSWIVKSIAGEKTDVSGYTRHTDGWLRIADDVSAFFYAQVGPGRANRLHLSDIFATQMNVDLQSEDWAPPTLPACDFGLAGDYVVLHPGASETRKTVPAFLWGRVLKSLAEKRPDLSFAVVGTKEEGRLVGEIRANAPGVKVIDLSGRTRFEELFAVVGGAKALIGADSAPMHIASFTGTPCLNVSVGDVCFWETGPRAPGSVIWRATGADDVSSEKIAAMADAMLARRLPPDAVRAVEGIPCFVDPTETEESTFAWDLVRAMYLGTDYPTTGDFEFLTAVRRLIEMNDVVLEQLDRFAADAKMLGDLMDRADEVFHAVARLVPAAGVLVRWVMTEKSRIPPGGKGDIRDGMKRIHGQLRDVLALYDIEKIPLQENDDGKV